MALGTGAWLGPYEILAPLGHGGMGEVYRARDTKLGRDVAIKILPELFAADPERLARFEREAHLLASRNRTALAHWCWSWWRDRRSRTASPTVRFHSTTPCRSRARSRRRST